MGSDGIKRNNSPMPLAIQVAFLYAATQGMLPKDMSMKTMLLFKEKFPDYFKSNFSKLYTALNETGDLSGPNEELLRKSIENWFGAKLNDATLPVQNGKNDQNVPAAAAGEKS